MRLKHIKKKLLAKIKEEKYFRCRKKFKFIQTLKISIINN